MDASGSKICSEQQCAGVPCTHAGGGAESSAAKQPTKHSPTRTHETDILVFDIYAKGAFVPLDFLEQNVRGVRLPCVTWCEAPFLQLVNDPAEGVNRLRVSCLLKDSGESCVHRVEEALGCLQYGNHGAVSSVAFRGFSAC